jgi:hypothetical protein
MNKYNPKIHYRKSIRLKGYDYAQAGLYFITICCQNRICRFGNVSNGVMIFNDVGRLVEKWYFELGNKFSDIHCLERVVMPNHLMVNYGNAMIMYESSEMTNPIIPSRNTSLRIQQNGRIINFI